MVTSSVVMLASFAGCGGKEADSPGCPSQEPKEGAPCSGSLHCSDHISCGNVYDCEDGVWVLAPYDCEP
jgi:hypothetical protein